MIIVGIALAGALKIRKTAAFTMKQSLHLAAWHRAMTVSAACDRPRTPRATQQTNDRLAPVIRRPVLAQ
jgi:hypothetical protein